MASDLKLVKGSTAIDGLSGSEDFCRVIQGLSPSEIARPVERAAELRAQSHGRARDAGARARVSQHSRSADLQAASSSRPESTGAVSEAADLTVIWENDGSEGSDNISTIEVPNFLSQKAHGTFDAAAMAVDPPAYEFRLLKYRLPPLRRRPLLHTIIRRLGRRLSRPLRQSGASEGV